MSGLSHLDARGQAIGATNVSMTTASPPTLGDDALAAEVVETARRIGEDFILTRAERTTDREGREARP